MAMRTSDTAVDDDGGGIDADAATWAVHFPGNLRWSNAMQIVKGMVAYGAAAMAEIDLITQRLKARAGRSRSRPGLDGGMVARGRPRRCRSATRPTPPATPSPPATSTCAPATTTTAPSASSRRARRSSRCIARRCAATRARWSGCIPRSSASRCPTRTPSLPAWFVKGRGAGQRPTVVLFDGMDNAKEMSVIFAGLDFAKRGINTLAIDGPGQSEPLRLRNIHSRHDYEAAGIPAYDYVASRPEVDPKRVAVMGYSFGGYHAPRICAFEKRYAACVASARCTGASTSSSKATTPTDPRTSSASTFQFRWVVGAPDNATALEWSKKFTLEGVADKVECPFLMLHGENDRDRAALGREEALRSGRLEEQALRDLHRRGRRRRALPGRQPAARRRLHRRLAA